MASDTKIKIGEDGSLDINKIFPVGSLYMTITKINPSTFIGGTWSLISGGRMLMGCTDSDTKSTTGGSNTKTIAVANLPAHNHTFTGSAVTSGGQSQTHTHTFTGKAVTSGNQSAGHTHSFSATTSSNGSHSHTFNFVTTATTQEMNGVGVMVNGPFGDRVVVFDSSLKTTTSTYAAHTHTISGTSGGISANHTHSVTASGTNGNASQDHTHSVTAKGTIGNTGSGTALDITPAYTKVFIWQRTA